MSHKEEGFSVIFKRIAELAIPMVLSYTFSFAIVAIGMLASRLNQDAAHMAATTLIMTTTNTLTVIALSPLFAMSIVASHLIGKLRHQKENGILDSELDKTRERIAAVNKSGMIISVVASPIVFLLMFFSKAILVHVLGQDTAVAQIAQVFLRIYAFAMPAILFRIVFEQMMFSFAKTKAAMIMGVISFGIGTLLAIFLAFGGFEFKGLGLSGIAIGYLIEAYITVVFFGLYLAYHPSFIEYRFFKLQKMKMASYGLLLEILKIGGPISFTVVSEMILTFVLGIAAGLVGTLALAALNFAMQFVFFAFVVLSAFGQACCQEVSRELGAKQYLRAKYLAIYGLLTTLIFIMPCCIFVTVYPNILMLILDNQNIEIYKIVKILIPIIALTVLFDAMRYNILQVLRACGDHFIAAILSIASILLGIMLIFILGLFTKLGVYGIGLGYLLSIFFGLIVLFPRWLNQLHKLPMVKKI